VSRASCRRISRSETGPEYTTPVYRTTAAPLDLALHCETAAESCLDDSDSSEAARKVEAFCVRVADNIQEACGALVRDARAVVDEQAPDSAFPEGRIDEERIEFSLPVLTRHDRGESDYHPVLLRHEDVALGDLLERQGDRIRMRKQRVAIPGIRERGAPLQRLQMRTLALERRADDEAGHLTILRPRRVTRFPRFRCLRGCRILDGWRASGASDGCWRPPF